MYFLRLAAVLAVVVSTAATPVPAADALPPYYTYNDKFDDHQTPVASIGTVNTVGIYNALQYNGLSYANSTLQVVSPTPPSKPNYIFGGLTDQTQITLRPANSSVLRFDFYALFYACALNGAGTPQSCTIQISGRKAAQYGSTTAVKQLIYNPANTIGGLYNFVTFPAPDFRNLIEVSIAVIATKNAPGLTLPLFDNVQYRAYFKQPIT